MRKLKTKKQNLRLITKNKRKESGITLIALVVTIVVLLILAGVSISMLTGENGIITQAIEAQEKTDIADEKERVQLAAVAAAGKDGWGEITEDNLAEELTKNIGKRNEDYTLTKEGENFLVTYIDSNRSYLVDENGNVLQPVKREGLEVGDYIDYKPDVNTEGYSAANLTYLKTGSNDNTSTIRQDTGMTWQILRIYEDGSLDLIGNTTSQRINLVGDIAYGNGVAVMNDICEALYSRGNIKARSVNYEDIEYWLTPEGKAVRDGYSSYTGGPTYGHTQTYTSTKVYLTLYAQEKGAKIDSGLDGLTAGIDKEAGNTTGLGISEEGEGIGFPQANTSLTVTQTYWECSMNSTNFGEGYKVLKKTSSYWVASRSAACGADSAMFSLRYVTASSIGGTNYRVHLQENGLPGYSWNGFSKAYLRPVVTLSPSVQIENCTGTNGVDNMHKITQY